MSNDKKIDGKKRIDGEFLNVFFSFRFALHCRTLNETEKNKKSFCGIRYTHTQANKRTRLMRPHLYDLLGFASICSTFRIRLVEIAWRKIQIYWPADWHKYNVDVFDHASQNWPQIWISRMDLTTNNK